MATTLLPMWTVTAMDLGHHLERPGLRDSEAAVALVRTRDPSASGVNRHAESRR
jgi:hypothetical protein